MIKKPDWSGAAPEIGLQAPDSGTGLRDRQLATPDGRRVTDLIDGVRVSEARTIPDHRGTLCVILDPRRSSAEEPIVYSYQVTIRPGAIKGWIRHATYADRLFMSMGTFKWVLYDDREGSPTRGALNELFFDEHHRSLLRIPQNVWHAVQNVGITECLMISHPTKPYEYESPDKTRLPLDTELIPYSFR